MPAFLALLLGMAAMPAVATMGLAEWEVPTPGTNIVCSSDPFKADHGVCLRTPENLGGKRADTKIAVSHIEWWQYYPGYVIGKAREGYFLFHETRRTVAFEPTKAALSKRLEALGRRTPSGRRLLPKDGWEMVWSAIVRPGAKPRRNTGAPGGVSPGAGPVQEGPAEPGWR